jgi:crotonobetainyl-CoA:carnitine CoA-transferase CaiB-like acyl-CoA transferase
MPGALDGISVLDLTSGIAGPMATMMLADNGAAVTRIEPPGGDRFAQLSGYAVWHRGKQRTVLDLTNTAGRAQFAELTRGVDVVVDSFSPTRRAAFGLTREQLAADNPLLITCSITGYGQDNRHSDRPGYDLLVAARTGVLFDQKGRRGTAMEYISGRPGPNPEFGSPEGMVRGADRAGPIVPRSNWPSLGAALLATLGITAALRAREKTGEGQEIQTSLLQGALASVALNWQRVEEPDAPLYWMWPVDSRSIEGLFECSDRRWVHHWTIRPDWVRTVSGGDRLEVPDLDHNYRDDPDRIGMGPEDLLVTHFLYPELAEAFRRFPSADWERVAAESGMGVAKVRSPGEALADPAYLDDGCVVEVDHPEHGPIRHVGNVIELAATPGIVRESVAESETSVAELLASIGDLDPVESTTHGDLTGPLSGITVIDLGLGVAGPFASRLLADLGAAVIKVHSLRDGYWSGTHMGLGTNRGKRSISLDLKDPRGLEILHRLIGRADVLTTNWRPGAAARLGIDEASLRAAHPGLVICNSRGYERGPRSNLPGTDQTANALCGTEWEDGACSAGNAPLWSRSGMGDTGNALLSAIGISMALFSRERSGRGQAVGTSIVNACLLNTSYAWIHADGTPGGWDQVDADQWGFGPYYRIYPATDGWIAVAAVTPEHRAALLDALEIAKSSASSEALESRLAAMTAGVAFGTLDDVGVPVEIVNEEFCRELFDDPEAADLGLVAVTRAQGVGQFEDPGVLVDFSTMPTSISRGPCICGEHTREILRELEMDDAEIDELADVGVILDESSRR